MDERGQESEPLKCYHHLLDRRRRYAKEALRIRLCWCDTVDHAIGANERQVLALQRREPSRHALPLSSPHESCRILTRSTTPRADAPVTHRRWPAAVASKVSVELALEVRVITEQFRCDKWTRAPRGTRDARRRAMAEAIAAPRVRPTRALRATAGLRRPALAPRRADPRSPRFPVRQVAARAARRMLDHESGHNSPNFIAFRIMEPDGQLLTVVAALDPDYHDRAFPWARWYHEHGRSSEFKKVPGKYREMAISDAVAKTMIELIRARRPLPSEFVAGLRIRD